jgi:hypothetical protein
LAKPREEEMGPSFASIAVSRYASTWTDILRDRCSFARLGSWGGITKPNLSGLWSPTD